MTPPQRFRVPISIRLTLWYGLSLIVLLALFFGVLVTGTHFNQHLILHQRLFSTQAELMPHVRVDNDRLTIQPSLDSLGSAYVREGPLGLYVRLLSVDGDILAQSSNFDNRTGFMPNPPEDDEILETNQYWDRQLMRVMYAPVLSRTGDVEGWLEVGSFALDLRHQIPGRPLLAAILLTVVLALIGGYLLARHALKPVGALAEAARRILPSDLGVRLPVAARFRDELTDLAEAFNTMLDRLEAAFERERRFTANAAHEIMNPLAAVRNEAETTLRRPRDAPRYEKALQTIRAESLRLGQMLHHLLQLAHLDAGTAASAESIDLGAFVKQQIAPWREQAARQNLEIDLALADAAPVHASSFHLEILLDNLLDNALKYTPEGGTVKVCVRTEGGEAVLEVRDTGIGFTTQQAQHLFDRFYRAENPEVQAHAGSGLGLALVQALVNSLGGTITAHSDGPHRGGTFTIRLSRTHSPHRHDGR